MAMFERVIIGVGVLMLLFVCYFIFVFGYLRGGEEEHQLGRALVGVMHKSQFREYEVYHSASRDKVYLSVYGLVDTKRQDEALALIRTHIGAGNKDIRVEVNFREEHPAESPGNSGAHRTVVLKR